jgi:rod shape-determining protein MreD
VLWFVCPARWLQVAPALSLPPAADLLVRAVAGDGWPGWSMLVAPLAETLLWPASLVLAPQRRPPDPDKNRPCEPGAA